MNLFTFLFIFHCALIAGWLVAHWVTFCRAQSPSLQVSKSSPRLPHPLQPAGRCAVKILVCYKTFHSHGELSGHMFCDVGALTQPNLIEVQEQIQAKAKADGYKKAVTVFLSITRLEGEP